MITAYCRPITDEERNLAIAFQSVLRILYHYFIENKTGKIDKTFDYNDFYPMLRKLKPYSNYPFFKNIKQFLVNIDKDLKELKSANEIPIQDIEQYTKRCENALLSGNEQAFITYAQNLQQLHINNRNKPLRQYQFHPLHKQDWSLFGGTNGLLTHFEKEDQEKLLNFNLSKPLYTYLTIPENKLYDYEFMVWWIMHLKLNSKPVQISENEFPKYAEFSNSGEKFEELKKAMSDFLHSNMKELLPKIMQLINEIPEIKMVNDEKKNSITKVYRGIALDEHDSIKKIIEQDKNTKYISTSKFEHVARRFALRIGHLESEDNRRSEEGIILTYEVTPNSILFDTKILGGIFNESEIVIDASKSKVINYEFV